MPAASCALRGGVRLLRQPPDNATAPAGAAVIVCADGKFPATSAENLGRNSLPYVAVCLRKPATGSFAAEMDGRSARPFSLCERETKTSLCAGAAKGIPVAYPPLTAERRTFGNLPSGSESGQPGCRALRCGCFRLSELFPSVQRLRRDTA